MTHATDFFSKAGHALDLFWRNALMPHWSTALGAILALYVLSRQLSDRRPAGNVIAWGLLMLVTPVAGLVLFMLFGQRKRGEMARIRLAVARAAGLVREADDAPPQENRLIPGNRVKLLADEHGWETLRELREQIAAATDTIHITTYIFGNDETGRDIARRLAERARAGVKVRLLIDALGSRRAPDSLFDELTEAGGEVARFMPLLPWKSRSSANLRNHRKLAVFDGRSVITGGQNIADEYTGSGPAKKRFRDFGALIEGPAAAEYERIFASDWCFCTDVTPQSLRYDLSVKPDPVGNTGVTVVGSGPDYVNDPIWEGLVTLTAECRQEMLIVTPYLVPDEVLLRLFAAKARAGRKIRIITPKKSDHPFLDFARRHHLRILRDAGVEILFHENAILHGKMFVVDREVGVLGSANLDMRSLFVNFELATAVRDPEVVGAMLDLGDTLAVESKPSRSPRTRAAGLKERFLENLAHILAPIL